nr:hypothetical protein CFP56_72275 [Quercus suber]
MEIENTEEALPEECLRNLISLRTLCLCKCPLPQGMRYLTALQRLTVWRSEVVISNDWVEMEWQGLRTLLSLHFFDLPKLKSQISVKNQLIVQLFFLRIVEVEEKELKGAGAEPLPDSRRGLCIHGWEIETCKLSILTSSKLQLWEEKLQTSHLQEMLAGSKRHYVQLRSLQQQIKWKFRRLLSCTFILPAFYNNMWLSQVIHQWSTRQKVESKYRAPCIGDVVLLISKYIEI